MTIRVCPLCQAEFLEFKTVCSHCDVTLLDPDDDTDPRYLDEDDQVVYDLSAWPIDAQTDAAETLAESGIPHVWLGTEVLMPLVHEKAADVLLERIERDYGLDDAGAADDAQSPGEGAAGDTEYDLAGWGSSQRMDLVSKLVELSVPHRWEGELLVVPTSLERVVDAVLDEMEGLGGVDLDDGEETPDDVDPAEVLSGLFLAAERLRKGKVDGDVYGGLLAALDDADAERPPYGFEPRLWERVVGLGDRLADAVADDTDEIEQLGDELFQLLRPYV